MATHYIGPGQFPYPDEADVPDVPTAVQNLAAQTALIAGAGIAYAADLPTRNSIIAYQGLLCYVAAVDAHYKYNGSAWGLWGNYLLGTSATRTGMSGADLRTGVKFRETDTGAEYIYTSAGWVLTISQTSATMAAASIGSGGGTLGVGSITVAASNLYRSVEVQWAGMASTGAAAVVEFDMQRDGTTQRAGRVTGVNSSVGGSYLDRIAPGVSATYQLLVNSSGAVSVTADSRFTSLALTLSY